MVKNDNSAGQANTYRTLSDKSFQLWRYGTLIFVMLFLSGSIINVPLDPRNFKDHDWIKVDFIVVGIGIGLIGLRAIFIRALRSICYVTTASGLRVITSAAERFIEWKEIKRVNTYRPVRSNMITSLEYDNAPTFMFLNPYVNISGGMFKDFYALTADIASHLPKSKIGLGMMAIVELHGKAIDYLSNPSKANSAADRHLLRGYSWFTRHQFFNDWLYLDEIHLRLGARAGSTEAAKAIILKSASEGTWGSVSKLYEKYPSVQEDPLIKLCYAKALIMRKNYDDALALIADVLKSAKYGPQASALQASIVSRAS